MVWIGFCLIFNFFFRFTSTQICPAVSHLNCAELSELISCVHELPGLGSVLQVKLTPGPELKGMWRHRHTAGWSIPFHLYSNHLLASWSFVMRKGRETKTRKRVILNR